MESIGEILSRVMAGEALEGRLRHGPVFRHWSRIVGPFLAHKCWPVHVRKGVLLVRVVGPVWMQELQFQKPELLERMAKEVGPGEIKDIRFTTRGARTAASKRGMACVQELSGEKPLSPEQNQWVEQTASEVQDPDLKNTLKRILEHHLRARHRK